jgi:hypothetical protein
VSGGRRLAAALGGTLALFVALVAVVVVASGRRAGRAAPALALEGPRYLQLTQMLEVIVRNESEGPVRVVRGALDPGSRFAPAEGRDTSTDFGPGQRIDLKVAYGEVDCTEQPARPPSVELDVRTADGAVERVRAESEDGDDLSAGCTPASARHAPSRRRSRSASARTGASTGRPRTAPSRCDAGRGRGTSRSSRRAAR